MLPPYSRSARPMSRYVSFAASWALARGPSAGASSVTSNPTMRRCRAAVSRSSPPRPPRRPLRRVEDVQVDRDVHLVRKLRGNRFGPRGAVLLRAVECEPALPDQVVLLALGGAQSHLHDGGRLPK